MSDKEKYLIAVDARLCGCRNGSIIILNDGSRWKLSGMTVIPADKKQI